jgi:hypothetical protein
VTQVGDWLMDWTLPTGWVREVVDVFSIDEAWERIDARTGAIRNLAYRGSAAERCAMYGGKPRERRKAGT